MLVPSFKKVRIHRFVFIDIEHSVPVIKALGGGGPGSNLRFSWFSHNVIALIF